MPSFDACSPLMDFMEMNCCWTHTALRCWWNFGYDSESVLRILRHMPHRLSSAMQRLLNSLHFMSEYSTNRLNHMSCLADRLSNEERYDLLEDLFLRVEDEEREWEREEIFALIRIDFDPKTQKRKHVQINARSALLWNLKKSELLLRFANYDVPLPYTELDWLRILIFDLRSYFETETSHFYRMIVGSGSDARAMLVCVTKLKTFNQMGRISQLRYCIRAISPDVYDEVARSSPAVCPLIVTGDLRSGHELLKGARFDSMQTIESLASSRKGRTLLNALAEQVEQQVLAVEQALGWNRQHGSMVVPRPIAFNMSSISFDSESPVIDFCAEQGWVGMCSNWMFNVGYESGRTIRVLRSLPPRVHTATSRLIETMQSCCPAQLLERSRAVRSMYTYRNRCLTLEEEEIWEAETELGLMKVEYDPATQRRTNLAINTRYANMFGLHKEECLMRLALHEADSCVAEMCGVYLVLGFIMGSMNCEQMFYGRMCLRSGNEIRGVLAVREEVKRFNSQGQLTQVKFMCRVVSPQEYDEAAAQKPHSCPIYMMGDRRSGQQLIDSAAHDYQETVQSMASNPAGRARLNGLAEFLEHEWQAIKCGLLRG